MAAQPVVFLASDTTEIEVTRPEQQVAGAGPLDGKPPSIAVNAVLVSETNPTNQSNGCC